MRLSNSNARRPKTYGKKTGKSYLSSSFGMIASEEIWSNDCPAIQDDDTGILRPRDHEQNGPRSSTDLTREASKKKKKKAEEDGPITEQSSVERTESLDAAFQLLEVTSKDTKGEGTSQPRSPLSLKKVVNSQLSPERRISKAGIENAGVWGGDHEKGATISTSLIEEDRQARCRGVTRALKDTHRPDVQRRSTSRPMSPSGLKVAKTQLSPEKRMLRLGIEDKRCELKNKEADSTILPILIEERPGDGRKGAAALSKDTRRPDVRRALRPRNARVQRKTAGKGAGSVDVPVRLRPLLRLSHDEKDHHGPGDFQQWANELTALLTIEKIAEASYGEVYRVNGTERAHESVLKVIPLKPLVEGRSKKLDTFQMSSVEDVLTEARTLTRMTVIPGFTNLRDIRVMRGPLPKQFIQAWKRYHRDGVESYFPDPSRRGSYPKDQLWAIIEMENAGVDLEKFELRSMIQIWDIFWEVAMALAKGEELAEFEHRDLHLGNICVREQGDRQDRHTTSKLNIGYSNLKSTIIDYTLSRVEMEDEFDKNSKQRIAYLDLDKDPELFNGEGDYQYDIYRYMRSAIYLSDPLASFEPCPDAHAYPQKWQGFHSITNVLWLHFLLFALKTQLEKRTKKYIRFTDDDDDDDDENNNLTLELERTYEGRLSEMEKILDPKVIGQMQRHAHRSGDEADCVGSQSVMSPPKTAGRVVEYALQRGWLGEEDILECDL
ncbi:MAG: hypothetical protein M1816_002725 [Peltula sp. TS41687]|nr:MAG: hypothetical protein M1816_002725 [Peltula sp. TS41687]